MPGHHTLTPVVEQTMRAVTRETYCTGAGLEIREVPTPEPTGDKVVVQVKAASVNPFDWHMMTGTPYLVRLQNGLRTPKNRVPGVDVAGVVVGTGPDVTDLTIGDEVFGYARGSFAEYALGSAASLVAKPANVSFEQAAAVPLAGFTAIQALRDKGKLVAGDQVLINGAAGGVGTLAVQIAKSLGATVTGVCSSRNVDMVTALGTDHVIDYTADDFTAADDRYDVIVDNVGNHTFGEVRRVLSSDGRLVLVGGPKDGQWIQPVTHVAKAILAFAFRSQTVAPFIASENRDDLIALRELLESGQLTPVISQTFALADTAKAMDLIASGHAQAKVVVTP